MAKQLTDAASKSKSV